MIDLEDIFYAWVFIASLVVIPIFVITICNVIDLGLTVNDYIKHGGM